MHAQRHRALFRRGAGDITQAHQPNEFIELSQVDTCERFLRKLAEAMGA